MARLLSLRSHTTHNERGEVVEHPEGSTYELDDEGVVETLTAIGFARLDVVATTGGKATTETVVPPPPAAPSVIIPSKKRK